jgi:hypothetical protein
MILRGGKGISCNEEGEMENEKGLNDKENEKYSTLIF